MFITRKTLLYMQLYMVCFLCICASNLAGWRMLDCLHKCMKNIPYKFACTIRGIIFLMMNTRCSKHVEDKKSWIKTLI